MNEMREMSEKAEGVIRYHERTKHHPYRYARSPGYLDWNNEPNPFRRFEGSDLLELPFLEKAPEADFSALFKRKRVFHPISFRNVAAFLELSMGLSAWKSYKGSSWALRINPSSGNLHPTEAYLILPPMNEKIDKGGVFHYNPYFHALELRATIDQVLWKRIRKHFGTEGFFVGLSSIYWREAWKYGERAFRYCQLDIGHAMACLSFAANLMGWKATYLNSLSDQDIEIILGFEKTPWRKNEEEYPQLLLFIHEDKEKDIPRDIPQEIIETFRTISFFGIPNPLSMEHVEWKVIDDVSSITAKPKTVEERYIYKESGFLEGKVSAKGAAEIIRYRRSAQAFDGKTGIEKDDFFFILDRTIPRNGCAPFDLGLSNISIHLLIFVHIVYGLEPGLYFLFRDEENFEALKHKCHPDFLWKRVTEKIPLYLLKIGDFRLEAAHASCDQDIAGDGAFSLSMIAKFRENIERKPFLYRHLHWETGMIGHVLYLSAEALSMRGTAMGCFFDDEVHHIAGIRDDSYQDLYHFAVGKALEDKRLTTLPPYHHLARFRK